MLTIRIKCKSREEEKLYIILVGGSQQEWEIDKRLEAYQNVLGSAFLCTSQQNRQMQNFVPDIPLPITLLLWYIESFDTSYSLFR
jgi:hypothetical protein